MHKTEIDISLKKLNKPATRLLYHLFTEAIGSTALPSCQADGFLPLTFHPHHPSPGAPLPRALRRRPQRSSEPPRACAPSTTASAPAAPLVFSGSTRFTSLSLSLDVTSEVPFLTVQALALTPWSSLPCSLIFCFPYSACSYFIHKLTWPLSLQLQVQDGRSESASFALLSLHPRQGFECVRVIPEAQCNRDEYWGGKFWPNIKRNFMSEFSDGRWCFGR